MWVEAASDLLDRGCDIICEFYVILIACIPDEKLSIVELNSLLNGSKALLITPPELTSLRNLYRTTMAINDDANAFLDRAKFSITKKFK